MRYVVSCMNPPEQLDEASSRAAGIELYEAAIAASPDRPIRLLDRKKHEVIVQNYGDAT